METAGIDIGKTLIDKILSGEGTQPVIALLLLIIIVMAYFWNKSNKHQNAQIEKKDKDLAQAQKDLLGVIEKSFEEKGKFAHFFTEIKIVLETISRGMR